MQSAKTKAIKLGLLVAILVGSIGVGRSLSDHLATISAQKVFNAGRYNPHDVITFDVFELQDYSLSIAKETVSTTTIYMVGLAAVSLGLGALVVYFPSESKDQKLFRIWKNALRRGDTLKQAEVEVEVMSDTE